MIKDLVAKGADIFDDENEEGRGHNAFDGTCNAVRLTLNGSHL